MASVAGVACSATKSDEGPADLPISELDASDADGTSGTAKDDAAPFDLGAPFEVNPACKGLQCKQQTCPGGATTTVSGTVYAPNGTLPLYNVILYVPNADLAPLPVGVVCDKCGALASGDPISSALSDFQGKFQLKNVPVGTGVSLVIQLGKWRRQVSLPEIKPCVDNPITDANLTRLPKNQKEGNIPRIAVTTGSCDKLSCMLPKVGIDASEFGLAGQNKAVTFYEGGMIGSAFFSAPGPKGMTPARDLWGDLGELKKYDLAIFSCECNENPGNKNAASRKAVTDYLTAGGRIFTTDYQYTWFRDSPDAALKGIGDITGNAPIGLSPASLDTTFPKGKALADWLNFVTPGATYGKLPTDKMFDNFHSASAADTQTWATSGEPSTPAVSHPRFITVNTPVGKPPENQCGKAVHLDAHINSGDTIDDTFPTGCSSPIKDGEKAFAFFFFDLASCIQKESAPPKPPPVIK
ncbi:MAG: hypothetical protein NVSMB1_03410 [Polyangiales bacterium]